jgi:hypothetical protein
MAKVQAETKFDFNGLARELRGVKDRLFEVHTTLTDQVDIVNALVVRVGEMEEQLRAMQVSETPAPQSPQPGPQ